MSLFRPDVRMTETSHDVAGALRRNHARYLGHTHYWSVCLSVRVPVTVLVCVISMFTRCPLSHTQSLRHYLALLRARSAITIGDFRCLFSCCFHYMKVKVTRINIAPSRATLKALRHGSHSFTCKQHHTCLYLVSVHQMALPLIVITSI